jgi:SAM-dependent methyltransferase
MKKHNRSEALEVVRAGYDRLGDRYTAERAKADNWKEVEAFMSLLPSQGRVLDAGSGTGLPIARRLVEAGFEVAGIDFSKTMIATARKNVPAATFQQMDLTAIDLPRESFDGVISCYAIIHIPREFHADVFRSFHTILKPGGAMLVSVASWAWEEFADYLGVDMFWSHFDPAESEALIAEAGFEIEFGRDVESGGEKHHWVLARKG